MCDHKHEEKTLKLLSCICLSVAYHQCYAETTQFSPFLQEKQNSGVKVGEVLYKNCIFVQNCIKP